MSTDNKLMLIKYNHKFRKHTICETKLSDDIMIIKIIDVLSYMYNYMEIKICTVSMIHTCIHD